MKAYWDSSALIAAARELTVRQKLAADRGFSRRHGLAEAFSALTGKPHLRLDPDEAAAVVKNLASDLDFVELSTDDLTKAMEDAQSLGVRGGRIHDLLHARAALKSGAKNFLTLDRNDFANLVPGLSIEQV